MHIRCPHCHHALEIVFDGSDAPIKCPSCGSAVPGFDETLRIPRRRLESLGRFELLERVGRGHFGDVYRAQDTRLERQVAVKVPRIDRMDEATVGLFMHEARAAAQLHHPNIVRLYEVDQQDELVYIVSEFIRGESLDDRLESGRFEPRAAAQLCAQVAEALHFAHEAGVIHRDLKPSNIMLDEQGTPHLMDFGLAKQDASEISLTVSGDILGTPAYMSPEQARGDSRHADRRSDVYSLGVVLYKIVSGEHPFSDESVTLIRRVASDEPVSAVRIGKKLPRNLATICLKALAKDPSRRYATAQEMADDLRRYARGDAILARRESSLERSWRWSRRNPALVLTGSAAVLAVTLLTAALLWGGRAGGQPPPLPPRRVSITTEPPGAKLVFYPIDEKTGLPVPSQKIAAAGVSPVQIDLAPRDYLVVAYFDEKWFHEVLRRVPAADAGLPEVFNHLYWKLLPNGSVELKRIKIPDPAVIDDMARLEGQETFRVGSSSLSDAPEHQRRVRAFYLDPREVSVGDFKSRPMPLPKPVRDAMPPDATPVTHVWYKEAVHYAEIVGKRLPDEFEYEFAATLGGSRPTPWGESPQTIEDWKFHTVGEADVDKLPTAPKVLGLFSNVAEWTSSWPLPYPANKSLGQPDPPYAGSLRVVRGGSASVISGEPAGGDWTRGPRGRVFVNTMTRNAGLGFRCARSAKPRLTPQDFGGVVERTAPQGETNKATVRGPGKVPR